MSREDVKGQRGVFIEQKGLQARHSTEAAEDSEESWRSRPALGQSGDLTGPWRMPRPTVGSAGPQEKPQLLLKAYSHALADLAQ